MKAPAPTRQARLGDLDATEMVEHVYREGSYEKRWTGTRYKLAVNGYAHACGNSWTVDIRSAADLADPKAAAYQILVEEKDGQPPHRRITRVRLWDAKQGAFVELVA